MPRFLPGIKRGNVSITAMMMMTKKMTVIIMVVVVMTC